jgi:hypothetical protein
MLTPQIILPIGHAITKINYRQDFLKDLMAISIRYCKFIEEPIIPKV